MRNRRSIIILFTFFLGWTLLAYPRNSQALPTTYSYVGNNYDFTDDDPLPTGNYTLSMKVTGEFTVPDKIANNTPLLDISALVLTFSFNDGRSTITESSADLNVVRFSLATGGSGEVTRWSILVQAPNSIPNTGQQRFKIETRDDPVFAFQKLDLGFIEERLASGTLGTDKATIIDDRGDWTVTQSQAPIPEPSTMLLLGSGLAGLAFFRMRRKDRKNPSIT